MRLVILPLTIFEIRIAEFMLCVPQSEADSVARRANVKTHKLKLQTPRPKPQPNEIEKQNRGKCPVTFAGSSLDQRQSYGAAEHAPLEASNEALSKFGRSCR